MAIPSPSIRTGMICTLRAMRLHDGQMDGNGDTEVNKHTHNHINVATIATEKYTDMHVKDITKVL